MNIQIFFSKCRTVETVLLKFWLFVATTLKKSWFIINARYKAHCWVLKYLTSPKIENVQRILLLSCSWSKTKIISFFKFVQGGPTQIYTKGPVETYKVFASPGFFKFQSQSQSQIPQILNLSPGPSPDFKMSPSPGPRFPGPGLRDPGDPVPDADPFLQMMIPIQRIFS